MKTSGLVIKDMPLTLEVWKEIMANALPDYAFEKYENTEDQRVFEYQVFSGSTDETTKKELVRLELSIPLSHVYDGQIGRDLGEFNVLLYGIGHGSKKICYQVYSPFLEQLKG